MKRVPKFYYVYIITNIVLNKQYVGSKLCYKDDPHKDSYMGSSRYLKADYKIYGKKNFTKEILKDDYANVIDMLIGESENMHKYNTFEPNGYNRFDPMKNPGFHAGGCTETDDHKSKISKSLRGKPKSKEHKKNLSIAAKNRKPIKLSEEHKKHIGESNKIKTYYKTEEYKQKQKSAQKGKNRSKETRKKISDSHKGLKQTEETIQKRFKKRREEDDFGIKIKKSQVIEILKLLEDISIKQIAIKYNVSERTIYNIKSKTYKTK